MGKKPNFASIDGCLFPPSFLPEMLFSATKFKPGKGDVIVATYPKCGTTWVQQIILLMQRQGVPPTSAEEYFMSTPFLEVVGQEGVEKMSRPGVIKTHLAFDRITYSPDAKYVNVVRHPADSVVSHFHHVRYFPIYFFSDGAFDDFFDLFVRGEVDFGDYFDHLLSWYEHREKPNVLIITFEEIKQDTRGCILKIARFLGDEYHDLLLKDNGKIMEKVMEYSTVEYMKSSVGIFWSEVFSHVPPEEVQQQSPVLKKFADLVKQAGQEGHRSVGEFVRKGQVGEGKVMLSDQQKEVLNARIKEKTAGSDVMSLWNK